MLQRGQFQAASIEYQRALVDQPELTHSAASEIADKALQSLWLSRDFKASADLADFYGRKYPDRKGIDCVTGYYSGLSYYGLKAYPRSRAELALSVKNCPEPNHSHARYWMGLAAARVGDYADARVIFEDIGQSSPRHADAQAALKAVLAAEQLPRKSPRRAGFLNVILPGSGYAYAGFPQTGMASFLTTGLFTWGTVAAAQNGETALAMLLGSLNVAWYFGGIQGAANAATRTNSARLNTLLKPLEIN